MNHILERFSRLAPDYIPYDCGIRIVARRAHLYFEHDFDRRNPDSQFNKLFALDTIGRKLACAIYKTEEQYPYQKIGLDSIEAFHLWHDPEPETYHDYLYAMCAGEEEVEVALYSWGMRDLEAVAKCLAALCEKPLYLRLKKELVEIAPAQLL